MAKRKSYLILTADELSIDDDNCLLCTSLPKAVIAAHRIANKKNKLMKTMYGYKFDYLQKIRTEDQWVSFDGKATIKIVEREPFKITNKK